jgi:hypothetical protein
MGLERRDGKSRDCCQYGIVSMIRPFRSDHEREDVMETQSLHRGRLIDHIQLVVRDLEASHTFYEAVYHGPHERSAESVVVTFEG